MVISLNSFSAVFKKIKWKWYLCPSAAFAMEKRSSELEEIETVSGTVTYLLRYIKNLPQIQNELI